MSKTSDDVLESIHDGPYAVLKGKRANIAINPKFVTTVWVEGELVFVSISGDHNPVVIDMAFDAVVRELIAASARAR